MSSRLLRDAEDLVRIHAVGAGMAHAAIDDLRGDATPESAHIVVARFVDGLTAALPSAIPVIFSVPMTARLDETIRAQLGTAMEDDAPEEIDGLLWDAAAEWFALQREVASEQVSRS